MCSWNRSRPEEWSPAPGGSSVGRDALTQTMLLLLRTVVTRARIEARAVNPRANRLRGRILE